MKLINFNVGIDQPLFLIAGPCVIESEDMTLRVAEELKNVCIKLGVPFIFKSSFDKANRSSNSTFRGFGMEEGLRILEKVKAQFDLPVLTDIHTTDQVKPVSEIVDVLQTPAFLCRQTDFITAVAKSGRPVNIKKGHHRADGVYGGRRGGGREGETGKQASQGHRASPCHGFCSLDFFFGSSDAVSGVIFSSTNACCVVLLYTR